MISNRKYRFYILNTCDTAATYAVTDVTVDTGTIEIEIGSHTLKVGSLVLLDLSPITIKSVTAITSTTVTIGRSGLGAGSITTIKELLKKYVDPQNFYDTKFAWEQEPDEIFFRKLFSEPLKFEKEDFNYFRDYILPNECCEVKFIIEKRCAGEWSVEWQGLFTHNSCVWNLSHCWVEATFELDDFYRCLLYGWEDEQTVFEVVTYFERLRCCATKSVHVLAPISPCVAPCNSVIDALQDDGSGGITFDNEQIVDPCDDSARSEWQLEKDVITQVTFTNEEIENFEICTTWIREVSITMDSGGFAVPPAGDGWAQQLPINYNGLPAHKWTRKPYNGTYYTISDYTVVRDCDDIPCVRTWTVNFPDVLDTTNSQKSLLDVATELISGACPSLSGIRSDFFELNTPGDTPGFVAGTNYVTGAVSQITNLRLIQISSFLTVTSGTIEEIHSDMTLKQLLDALKIMFNCKWFVDAQGFLRIEHISWFQRSVALDTTIGNDNIRFNKSKKQFKYDRHEIPLKEKFSFVYQGYIDFIGKDIKYDSPCVSVRKTVKYDVPKFSTDLQNIRDNASEVKDFNSFILLACDGSNDVLEETGVLSGSIVENGHLSWANLHDNYHKYYRFLDSGYMNDTITSFLSVRRTKRQVPIFSVGCCEPVDPLTDLVKTALGDGQIDKMSKDNRDEVFTFELLYD